MNPIDRIGFEIDLIIAHLNSINELFRAKIYEVRREANLCIECGFPVIDKGDEYCPKCHDKTNDLKDEAFRDLQRDQKVK